MKIVIIGGVAAGPKVAAKSRRLLTDAQIDIYTLDTHVSYSACGLPYYIEDDFKDYKKLIVRSIEDFEKANINIHLQHEAINIDTNSKTVLIKKMQTGELINIPYDKLVIATGSYPSKSGFENYNQENLFTLKTLEDGIAIKSMMEKISHCTLIGGGYINIELAEAFAKNGKKVTIIEHSEYILSSFDDEISKLIQDYIIETSKGLIKVITKDTVKEFVGKDKIAGVLTENGYGFETDMAILSIGARPAIKLALSAGIIIGNSGAIKVNKKMETNIKDIYACGDCAEKFHNIADLPVWVPLGSTANKEGRIAAINLCGGNIEFDGIFGAAVTRFMNLNISKTGLSEKYAKSIGYETVSAVVTKKDKAGYMPEVNNITLKLIADKKTGKIIGAQAIGCGEANKKIDSITIGMKNNITIRELLDVDLTYSPPFASSVDIIHTAARMLQSKIS